MLFESLEAAVLNFAEMHEQVLAVLLRDETIALVGVEPLYCTFRHKNLTFLPRGVHNADSARHPTLTLSMICGLIPR